MEFSQALHSKDRLCEGMLGVKLMDTQKTGGKLLWKILTGIVISSHRLQHEGSDIDSS